ncbi:inversin isoform X5 [Hemicordylus capensis]|uniref:inversin isoform X5 n=1 Tax=Hemicordylus capensis TaxID=884348 RepID=UPI002302E980|nr:inversin isoform X5 [Hemicordylus capensis]
MACAKGNYRFMKLLLARRANWMKKDLEEITPLHLTTRHKNPKCLSLLLKYMAPGEVDTQDKNKQTALHWSAYYNNPEHVKLLIKYDSNIGIPDIEGKIPLHWAANHKDPSAVHTVKCILDAAPTESLLNWQDYEGRTPLHFAVADGNVAVVDLLTSYEGCNVTSYDNLFRTPLHWAALLGHAQIVHLLLERNKFGTIPSDSQGATPLHYAAQSNFAETVEAFLKHPSVKDDSDLEGRTSFMWAAGKGSNDVIRTMLNLKLDIDINMADKYGGTALHAAALSGHVSTVQLLLKHDAQVDATDVMKHTPLFRACEMGHKEVIQTLIKGGARVDLVDQDGHSPLHWAALGGNPDVCQILIENKINPNVQDYAGRTPLQCAAYGGYINCMMVLLENNADPNIQDKEGRTALHWLCNNGYLDAVKLLLGFGAFPNHMENNEERYTPLDYALLGAHHEVIQFMLEHGALSIAAIQDIAAIKIQAVYKGYKVRKAFQDRKNLLMKHEQLRKDAAAKKREEENRRKATEIRNELQNSKAQVQQQYFSERVRSGMKLHIPEHSNQQGNARSKRPPSGHMPQNQLGKSKESLATVLPNKADKTICHSRELLGEDHKRKKDGEGKENLTSLGREFQRCNAATENSLSWQPPGEFTLIYLVDLKNQAGSYRSKQSKASRTNSKSKSASVAFNSSQENEASRHQVEAKHQTISATSGRDDKKHKEPSIRANGTFMHASIRHNSSCKAASSGKKSETQSQSINDDISHCEAKAVCGQSSNCTHRSTRQSEVAFQGSPQQLKARSKDKNDERWSPAGSSRPGSAKVESVNIRRDTSSTAVTQTNKATHNNLTKKSSLLLANNARTTRHVPNKLALSNVHGDSPKLDRQTVTTPGNSEDQLCALLVQRQNIELVPSEIRMQMIEKERARKELFRKKNCAATIIQRAWRSFLLRKQFLQLVSAKQQCKEEDDKWREEMAAFCIEVTWKKHLNHTSLKSVSSGKNLKSMSKSSVAVNSTHKPSPLKQIYEISNLVQNAQNYPRYAVFFFFLQRKVNNRQHNIGHLKVYKILNIIPQNYKQISLYIIFKTTNKYLYQNALHYLWIFYWIKRHLYPTGLIPKFLSVEPQSSWSRKITDKLSQGGLSPALLLEAGENTARRLVRQRLIDIDLQTEKASLPLFYKSIYAKVDLTPAAYLFTITLSKFRWAFSRARFNVFPSALLYGKYAKLPYEERKCPCDQAVETVAHILLKCPIYQDIRHQLIDPLLKDLNGKDDDLVVTYLLDDKDISTSAAVAKFCYVASRLRPSKE